MQNSSEEQNIHPAVSASDQISKKFLDIGDLYVLAMAQKDTRISQLETQVHQLETQLKEMKFQQILTSIRHKYNLTDTDKVSLDNGIINP